MPFCCFNLNGSNRNVFLDENQFYNMTFLFLSSNFFKSILFYSYSNLIQYSFNNICIFTFPCCRIRGWMDESMEKASSGNCLVYSFAFIIYLFFSIFKPIIKYVLLCLSQGRTHPSLRQ